MGKSNKRTSVFGIYKTRAAAEYGIDALIGAGLPAADISVLLPHDVSLREFAHEKHTKAPEGTTTGVIAGGTIGGTLGLLSGLGALAIPGLGPFIAAGPVMAMLAGVGAGGAVGGLIGALSGMGIPEYEAKRYEGHVQHGGVLVSAHCNTAHDIEVAKEVFARTGAEDVASAGEVKAERDEHVPPSPPHRPTFD
jgi:hypothetical protein